jgi:PAS domain S-box-containing protein
MSRVRAVTFPGDDAVFGERVREILAGHPIDHPDQAIEILERRLRGLHPGVTIRVRSEVAGLGGAQVLYVFRDGSALSSFARDEWTGDPSTARVVTDGTGRYLDANAEAATLFGVARDDIVGRSAGTFTTPDERIQDADALWRSLATSGRLHSLALVHRPDSAAISVEFVTIRDGDGPGRNVTFLRSLAAG